MEGTSTTLDWAVLPSAEAPFACGCRPSVLSFLTPVKTTAATKATLARRIMVPLNAPTLARGAILHRAPRAPYTSMLRYPDIRATRTCCFL